MTPVDLIAKIKPFMTIVSVIGAIATIVSLTIVIETRYAKAADIKDVQKEQQMQRQTLESMRLHNLWFYQDTLQEQKRQIEKDIAILKRKPVRSHNENVLLEEYADRLKGINARLEKLENEIKNVPVQ